MEDVRDVGDELADRGQPSERASEHAAEGAMLRFT
jgi:hypothetical protein